MKKEHYDQFFADAYSLQVDEVDSASFNIIRGALVSRDEPCKAVSIIDAIPRFVVGDNYSDNFGLQWNTFQSTQLDSYTGLRLTSDRLWDCSKWNPKALEGKLVLEAGSGAGRFTEILADAGARVVSFDYSRAIDANYANNNDKGSVLFFQGDMYNLPLQEGQFDFVLCYGVLQHTPDPARAYRTLFKMLKPGGMLSIDYYLKTREWGHWSKRKYVWRPLTSRMKPKHLLAVLQCCIPVWLPIDTLIRRRLPGLGAKLLAECRVPCWNYTWLAIDERQKVEWSIMDTFDGLGAKYDFPKTLDEVKEMVASRENERIDVFYGGNGVVANVQKKVTHPTVTHTQKTASICSPG